MQPEASTNEGPEPQSGIQRYARRGLLIAAIVVVCIVGIRLARHDIQTWVERMGIWAPLITIPIQAAVSVSPFPSDLLCIANGAVYGYSKGVLFSWIGWWLGSLVEFQLARSACEQLNLEQHRELTGA